MSASIAGKVVVITGAGQGIGRGYARRLAGDMCRVVVADINAERGRAVESEVRQAGGEAMFAHVDVADEASCATMCKEAVDTYGRIDALVNNAAIFSTIVMKPFWEIPQDEWDALLAVNLRGVWSASKAVLPYMRDHGGGTIINMSSGAYWQGRPGYAHYIASKAGVLGLTRAMARELGQFSIRVNAITPGPVYTEVPRQTVTEAQKQAMLDAQCLHRPANPADLAGTVAFLVSDDSAFITGQTFNVDGGLLHH